MNEEFIRLSPLNYLMHFRVIIILLIFPIMIFINDSQPDTFEIVFSNILILGAVIAFFLLRKLLKYKIFTTDLSERDNHIILTETIEKLNWKIEQQPDKKRLIICAPKKKLLSQPDIINIKVDNGFIKINSLYYLYGGKSWTTDEYLTEFVKTFRQIKKEKINSQSNIG
jgi:hypothetical protein